MVTEIKRLPEDTRSFQAGDKKYIVHDLLSFDAYVRLEELEVEILSGNTPRDMTGLLKKAYDCLNTHRFADASVHIYNSLNIGERIQAGKPPAWIMALTLFVRPEGSDLAVWEEAEALQWIEDWNNEGYAPNDLFTLACVCRNRLDIAFAHNSQDISSESSESGTSAGEPMTQRS